MGKMKTAASSTMGAGILFMVVGLIFFFLCLFAALEAKRFSETAQQTTAVVTNVEKHRVRRNGKTRTDYDIYVEYEVNGQVYNDELSGVNVAMSKGEIINIYYDPANPGQARSGKGIGAQVGGAVFALVFVVLGFLFGIKPAIKGAKRKKLKETGVRANAVITEIVLDRSTRINKRHPYKINCEFTDTVTGETYLYASEGIMDDIRYLQGGNVDVYYNPADRREYYVDIESATGVNYATDNSVFDYR